jgi:hypothetical protein
MRHRGALLSLAGIAAVALAAGAGAAQGQIYEPVCPGASNTIVGTSTGEQLTGTGGNA